MTTNTDIANRALQAIGTRTTVSDAELVAGSTNEAIQINLSLALIRDRLLRMAPWNSALRTANLVYITSSPGTPENTSPFTTLWQPGQPSPPWAYEYQYPVDCLRACWIIPATQSGFAGGVPITTAVTGGAASFWQGPPIRFKVQSDTFRPVTAAAVAVGGAGYAVGDIITLAIGPNTSPPIGGPAQLAVTAIGGGGAVTTVSVVSQILGSSPAQGGSYFLPQTSPQAQASSTGAGTGATFNLTFGAASPQRVVLTNQEFATLVYVRQLTDPNSMDESFIDTWANILGATVNMSLTGDRGKSNDLIQKANGMIQLARVDDGNEGLTVNDVTPDWLRIRGIDFVSPYSGPYSGFDWGDTWTAYG